MADYTTKGSFNLGNQITLKNKNSNIDRDYGPYEGKTLAEIATLLEATIQAGKTIGVIENGQVVEYWWQNGEFVKKGGVTETSQIPELETEAKTIVEAINEIKRIQEEGGGDIDLSGIEQDIADLQEGKADKMDVVEVVGEDGNYKFDIYPNVLNVLLAVDNTAGMCDMYIRKVGEESSKVNNYFFKVTFPESTGGSLSFNWGITWYGGEVPTWQAGKTYEVSIIDGLALWAEF